MLVLGALTFVSITSYMVADFMKSELIYESLLERFSHNNVEDEFIGNSKHKVLIETAISLGTMLEGKRVKEIKWPNHCLLVGIKRGGNEIIPKGDTTIYAGDYLIVLSDEDNAANVNKVLTEMSNKCELERITSKL